MSISVLAACSSTSVQRQHQVLQLQVNQMQQLLPGNSTSSDSSSSSSSIDWSALPTTTEVTLSNDGLKITEGGTYIPNRFNNCRYNGLKQMQMSVSF